MMTRLRVTAPATVAPLHNQAQTVLAGEQQPQWVQSQANTCTHQLLPHCATIAQKLGLEPGVLVALIALQHRCAGRSDAFNRTLQTDLQVVLMADRL